MQTFDLKQLLEEQRHTGQRWREFLRVPSLSLGIYHLKAGQTDPQQPHTEDEVYYVICGEATLQVGDQLQPIGPGTLIFVERSAEHRFREITEDLSLLVFFAPAEGSSAAP
jgi:mannose-6-phosphate isomerase-like protein (cupin superfamily)